MNVVLEKEENVRKKILADGGKWYRVGIYARLSVDGGEKKRESIEMQIEYGKQFIKEQKNMELYDCYTDIGRSGMNFRREGVERLLRDAQNGIINCIVVKDLSRFGRNYIEVGDYLEKIFPLMKVRFVAVADGYDSLRIHGDDMFGYHLKNLMNEMYARDIGIKVRSAKKAKWEKGGYTGGVPPYGYEVKWVSGVRKLVPEEITGDIVRKIYEMFLEPGSLQRIAKWLYDEKIQSPAQYRKTGQIYGKDGELSQWSVGTIKRILVNAAYMGCCVRRQEKGWDYMLRDRKDMDSPKWKIRKNEHEALVSEDMFFEAVNRFGKYGK